MNESTKRLLHYAHMVDAERAAVIDTGCFNSFIAAYMVLSMRCAGFSDDQIRTAENTLHVTLEDVCALDAVRRYAKFDTTA